MVKIQDIKEEVKTFDRKKVYRKKVKMMQEELSKQGLDGVICFKPQNTFFLSGFNPILYSHPVVVVVPTIGEPVLLVHSLRANHSSDEAALDDIRLYGMWANQKPIASDAYKAIGIIFEDLKLKEKCIGYEGDFISISQFNRIKNATNAAEFKDVSELFNSLRSIKDEYEICMLKMSSYLTNVGIKAALENMRKSEIEASISAEIAMRRAWSEELGEFEVSGFGNTEGGIVSTLWSYSNSGYRVPYGCECSSNRVPLDGEVCLPVVWAAIGGYHSENERTVMIGKIPENYEKAYSAMLKSRKRGFEAVRDGVTAGEVYSKCVEPYIEAGFNDFLPGRVGHGLGLSLHEQPSLSKDSNLILKEGMVITIEPGLVFAGWGSVRHSDTVVVRKYGAEILTETDEEWLIR